MATFAQIKEVRLLIGDPSGVIDIIEVVNQAAIPSPAAPQTAYKATDTGYYYIDGEVAELRVSDDRISSWIDTGGIDYAVYKCIEQILNQIGQELFIVRSAGGAESVQFINLTTLRNYYESLLDRYGDKKATNKTGRWARSKAIQIAGGDV